MTRKKLKHFAEMKAWEHVLEPTLSKEQLEMAGTWGERVVLELGCGRGNYTVSLARRFPEAMVVGIDIKGARMWHGARVAFEEGLSNVRFLRIHIEDLAEYFAVGEVDEIWITFPDPRPNKGEAKKRLTSPRFLEIYQRILKSGGRIHLKTDNEALFDYSLGSLAEAGFVLAREVRDVYGPECKDALLQEVQTTYEKRYLSEGKRIFYGEWRTAGLDT